MQQNSRWEVPKASISRPASSAAAAIVPSASENISGVMT